MGDFDVLVSGLASLRCGCAVGCAVAARWQRRGWVMAEPRLCWRGCAGAGLGVPNLDHKLLSAAQATDNVSQRTQTHVNALRFLQPVAGRTRFTRALASRQIDQGELADTGNARGRVLRLN